MNVQAMFHNPISNYAFIVNEQEIHIRFRTAKNDVNTVILHYGMKFDWTHNQTIKMELICSDQLFDYYQVNLMCADIRLGYYFEVKDDYETIVVTEAGIMKEFDDTIADRLYFQFPSVHKEDIVDAPEWFRDAVFYQIFVDRFANGDPSISPSDVVPWDSKPTLHSNFGGDLKGIMDHLDYLCDLGITAIYLTPIFQSDTNHKYDIYDYMNIDVHFGTNVDFKKLVEKAHEKGIRIVLDAVFNHCSEKALQFQDVLKKGEQSQYKNWFRIHGYPVTQNPTNYDTFSTFGFMPKFNTEDLDLQSYLLTVVKYWTKNYDIDGWRLDVSDELSHDFLRKFRKTVKDYDKDLVIIGENWHNSNPWLMGDQFDTVMNYGFTYRAVSFFAKAKFSCQEFTDQLVTLLMTYSDPLNTQMFNFLDTHDTERFLYLAGENESSLRNALAFLYGYIGVPCIFYGTEIGLSGGFDPDCRKSFPWKEEAWNHGLRSYVKQLIDLRKKEVAIRKGNISFLSNSELFIMKRSHEGESVYIIINISMQEQPMPKEIRNQVSIELLSGTRVSGVIPANTSYYLK